MYIQLNFQPNIAKLYIESEYVSTSYQLKNNSDNALIEL
jgi:hypothetical protein